MRVSEAVISISQLGSPILAFCTADLGLRSKSQSFRIFDFKEKNLVFRHLYGDSGEQETRSTPRPLRKDHETKLKLNMQLLKPQETMLTDKQ